MVRNWIAIGLTFFMGTIMMIFGCQTCWAQSPAPQAGQYGREMRTAVPLPPRPAQIAQAAATPAVPATPPAATPQVAQPAPAPAAPAAAAVPVRQVCSDADCYRYRVYAVRVTDLPLRQQLTRVNNGERAVPGRGGSNSRNVHQEVPGWVQVGAAQYVTECRVHAGLYREVSRNGRVLPGDLVTDLGILSVQSGQYFETWVRKGQTVGQMLVLTSEDDCFRAGDGNRLYFYSAERRQVRAEGAFFTSDTFCGRPVRLPGRRPQQQC